MLGAAAGIGVVVWAWPMLRQTLLVVEWVRTAGPAGFAVLAAVYLLATLLMAPASWLQGATGFVYGPIWGFLLALCMSTVFGTLSFLLARGWLRGLVEQRVRRDPRFLALDEVVGDGGAYLVGLLRVSPISPYNLVNYMLGLTRLPTRDYMLGSMLGSAPPILFYSYVGSSVGSVAELLDGTATSSTGPLHWMGLATTLIATVLVTRFARDALRRALLESNPNPEPSQ